MPDPETTSSWSWQKMFVWGVIIAAIVVIVVIVAYFVLPLLKPSSSSDDNNDTLPYTPSSSTPSSSTPSSASTPPSSSTPSSTTSSSTTSPSAVVCYQWGEMNQELAKLVYTLYPELNKYPYSGLYSLSSVTEVLRTSAYVIVNLRCEYRNQETMSLRPSVATLTVKHDLDSCDYPELLGVTFANGEFPNFGVGCWYDLEHEPVPLDEVRQLFNAYYFPFQFVQVNGIYPVNAKSVNLSIMYLDTEKQVQTKVITFKQTENCSGLTILGGHDPVYTSPPPPTDPPVPQLPGTSGTLINVRLPANIHDASFLYGDWWIDQSRGYFITFNKDGTFRYFSETGSYSVDELKWSMYPAPLTLTRVGESELAISYVMPFNTRWPSTVKTKVYFQVWNRKVQ